MTVAADVRIGATQAIQIGPGQSAQPLHRDDTAFLWRHPTGGRSAGLPARTTWGGLKSTAR
jgi:hypothetical protein